MAPERRFVLKYPIGTGILYTVETVLVFFALNTVTLSYYTIMRSGFIIFNIIWFKYLLKKPVTRLYYASCASLAVSHVIASSQYAFQYQSQSNAADNRAQNVVQNTIIILVSCFLNSAYNNVIEYAMSKHGDAITNIDFQIISRARISLSRLLVRSTIQRKTFHRLISPRLQCTFLLQLDCSSTRSIKYIFSITVRARSLQISF